MDNRTRKKIVQGINDSGCWTGYQTLRAVTRLAEYLYDQGVTARVAGRLAGQLAPAMGRVLDHIGPSRDAKQTGGLGVLCEADKGAKLIIEPETQIQVRRLIQSALDRGASIAKSEEA